METGLRGKRILVTGASGGIGSACVRAFVGEGAEVVGHYNRGRERAEALGVALVQGDLTSAFLTARGFLRSVARTGHGSLVLVSSTAGIFGEAGHADYAAAKSALAHGFLLSLKNEVVRVAPRARVNCVCPGWTRTPMARAEVDDPDVVERVTRTMALRKVATPE